MESRDPYACSITPAQPLTKTIAAIMNLKVEDLILCPPISARKKEIQVLGGVQSINDKPVESSKINPKPDDAATMKVKQSLPSVWVGRMQAESKVCVLF